MLGTKIDKKERVLKTLNCEETDRPPWYDLIRNDAVIEYFSGEKLTIEDGKRITLKSLSNMLDATKQFIRFPQNEEIVEENGQLVAHKRWTAWKIKSEEYNKEKWIEKIRGFIHSYRGWCTEYQIELDRDIADLKEKQISMPDVTIFMSGDCGGPYSFASYCGGFDKLSYLIADDPLLVSEGLEIMFCKNMDIIKHLPERPISPMVFVGEDIAYKSGLVFSPRFLKREFFPRFKRIVEAYHEKGLRIMFHSDGNIMEIMDDLMDCGIDALNPIETMAGMNLKELRQKYPKLILVGGIDCSELLPHRCPSEIKKVVQQAIKDTKYGYFVGSSSEIHNEIPLINVLAMHEIIYRNKLTG